MDAHEQSLPVFSDDAAYIEPQNKTGQFHDVTDGQSNESNQKFNENLFNPNANLGTSNNYPEYNPTTSFCQYINSNEDSQDQTSNDRRKEPIPLVFIKWAPTNVEYLRPNIYTNQTDDFDPVSNKKNSQTRQY